MKFFIGLTGFFLFGLLGGGIAGGITESAGMGVFFGIIFAIIVEQGEAGLAFGVLFAIAGVLVQLKTNQVKIGIARDKGSGSINEVPMDPGKESYASGEFVNGEAGRSEFTKTISQVSSTSMETSKKFGQNYLNNARRLSEEMGAKEKPTAEEIGQYLAQIFYASKLLKYIMPVSHYILYFLVVFSFIRMSIPGQSFYTGWYINFILFTGLLCFARQQYRAISISFGVLTLIRLIEIYSISRWGWAYIPSFILMDTLIIGFIAFLAFRQLPHFLVFLISLKQSKHP